MTNNAPIVDKNAPENKSISDQEAHIQSQNKEIDRLQESNKLWNRWYQWCLVLAVVAGIGSLLTTRSVLKKTDEITALEADVMASKNSITGLRNMVSSKVIADALDRASKASIKASGANRIAEQANRESEILRADNLDLEARLAPRRLTDFQISSFKGITRFPRLRVEVKSYVGDVEAVGLGSQIMASLMAAGISTVDARSTAQPLMPITFGIRLEGVDPSVVEKLRSILTSDDNFLQVAPGDSRPSNEIDFGIPTIEFSAMIFVGVKPISANPVTAIPK